MKTAGLESSCATPSTRRNGSGKTVCLKFTSTLAACTLFVATLAACFGGSGDESPPPSYQPVVTDVPAATYSTPDAVSVYTLGNAIRQESGSGLLAQSTALDTVATNHVNYLINHQLVADGSYLNTLHEGVLGGHYEDPAKAGFSGKTPQDRATKAGFNGTVNEIVTFGAGSGDECMASLENSVYHLLELISPFVNVGLNFNAGSGSGSVCAIVLGTPSTTLGQLPAAGTVVTYPTSGETNLAPVFYNQAEAPVPAPDLNVAGHPAAVSLYTLAASSLAAGDVVVHSFTLTPAGGAAIAARILAHSGVVSDGPALTADDAIPGYGFVVLLPMAPLNPNTVYQAAFTATVRGAAMSKSWSFTTGAAN